jgi:hypothetical protein
MEITRCPKHVREMAAVYKRAFIFMNKEVTNTT